MNNSGTEINDSEYENQISKIIQEELIDLYGLRGYKSIIQTMIKFCEKTEKEIITNYELFSELIEKVFGKVGNSKILFPIKIEIGKIETEKIHQEGR